MHLKSFWFSYRGILLNEIVNKNYFTFFRKIFGAIYKFILKFFRNKFSSKINNLDNPRNIKLFQLNLDKLFSVFNCDKGSYWVFNKKKKISHNYSIFYEKYFRKLRKKKLNILEVGSHEGKGIASFFFYFPKSIFIGANINPFQMKYKSNRISEIFVDVSSVKILNFLSMNINKQDIIIDDASHNLRDILISFSILFKKLKNGGIYVIEDMDQFKVIKELNPYKKNESTPKEILKKIKNRRKFHSSFISEKDKVYLTKNIKDIKIEKGSMIMKEKNISDIAFIFKR